MDRLQACLVDAYDTILTCDFSVQRRELAALAGLGVDAWSKAYEQIMPALTDGRLSKAEGFGEVLRACRRQVRPDLVRAMVSTDRELLLANAWLFDDAVPFLSGLRARGIKIAIVSNCTENTRPLLSKLGVDALADAVVLSCEVGAAKPSAEIFRLALERLRVTADAAVFVDDQAGFCAGGIAAGIRAVQIVRDELDGVAPRSGMAVVRSLAEVATLFGLPGPAEDQRVTSSRELDQPAAGPRRDRPERCARPL
jgi:putative hydrolase of the HAD superfamily